MKAIFNLFKITCVFGIFFITTSCSDTNSQEVLNPTFTNGIIDVGGYFPERGQPYYVITLGTENIRDLNGQPLGKGYVLELYLFSASPYTAFLNDEFRISSVPTSEVGQVFARLSRNYKVDKTEHDDLGNPISLTIPESAYTGFLGEVIFSTTSEGQEIEYTISLINVKNSSQTIDVKGKFTGKLVEIP